MDQLFSLVQNLQYLGVSIWVQARTIDESHVRIEIHYQNGGCAPGLIGEDNVRIFNNASFAFHFLHEHFLDSPSEDSDGAYHA